MGRVVFSSNKLTKNYGNFEEKKVGVARLQPTPISLDYSKL